MDVQQVENVKDPKYQMIIENFRFFGIGCILYGILFAICLYYGFFGISVPILTIGTQIYLILCFKRLQLDRNKKSYFYLVTWLLLGISNCLTGSGNLVFFNTCGMFLLFLCFLFENYFHTEKWGFDKFLLELIVTPFAAVGNVDAFILSAHHFFTVKEEKKNSKAKYVWLGILIAIPLLIVILALLASADVVFKNILFHFSWNFMPKRPIWFIILFVVGIFGSHGMLAYLSGKVMNEVKEKEKKWEPVVGITFLSILTIVYLVFSVIQISYLFLGEFTLPSGVTYAEYARSGFFQLLFVCLINLATILICISFFREQKALKIILTIFSACTYIMLASSAMRMILYIEAYQLTFLRLIVLWALVVIAISLIYCLITIYKPDFRLFSCITITVTVCYLVLSFARPDYVIAKYNLVSGKEKADLSYLFSLSSDAVAAMDEEGLIEDILINEEFYDRAYPQTLPSHYYIWDESILSFNFSHYKARNIIDGYLKDSELF